MRVAVIGSGVVGATTAYELALDGHEVTVFERRASVASEGSFANAGIVAPAFIAPWAAPGMSWRVLNGMFGGEAPLQLRPPLSASEWRWLWRWWRACNSRSFRTNRVRLQRLATFSHARMRKLTHTLQLDYERGEGYLVLLRTAKEAEQAQPMLTMFKEMGVPCHLLDVEGCRRVEPGISAEAELHAGIHLEHEEIGNCRQFALLMRDEAERLGAQFRFSTNVLAIEPGRTPTIVKQQSSLDESTWIGGERSRQDSSAMNAPGAPDREVFDAVVVCAALDSARLLKPIGLKLPLAAVYGYSITAPVRRIDAHPEIGPHSVLLDHRHQISIGRLGARMRVSGVMELGGSLQKNVRGSVERLYTALNEWFAGAAQMTQVQVWKGACAMLPDGPPVIGASGAPGVWLNLGHGSDGWALACGSARVVADALSGTSSAIDIDGLGIERLRH